MTTFNRRTLLVGAAAATLAPALVRAQGAADWPKGALRIIVPFPPGGSTDLLGRLIAPRMSELLGGTVTPENRSGASGVVGAGHVAQYWSDESGRWEMKTASGGAG